MFRTSNIRGQKRFEELQKFIGSKNGQINLNRSQIALIEDAKTLSLNEKIELLLVSLGNKLTTELYMSIQYLWDEKQQLELPDQKNIKQINNLLSKLPFIFFQDALLKNNRQTGKKQKFVWFQVSINKAVSEFMKAFPDDLTEFEEGVLYGYPLSAIRAYAGLIKAKHDKPTPASYYLAGVCSQDFWQDEQEYYQMWWGRLKKLSPKIVKVAEDKFCTQH